MVNEYTSRFYRDKENFSFKAYHSSRNLSDMCDIFSDGCLDPEAEHKGECPYDIIWFTIGDDYDHGFRFSFQIDQDTFNEFDFRWMNDNHLATPNRIDVMDKRLRVETINGKSLDKVYERFYDGTQNGFNEFIDRVFKLSDYQLSNELFVMKILQQYGFRRSDYFMDDESQGLNEDMMEDKKKNNQYVRQDIMLDVTAGDCGVMEGQLTEVEANDVNLKSFEIQDELNPKFWINNKINSRVRLKLLDLADEFFDSLNIKWVKPKDIVLTGSIANYNWSKYSDVDVHILVDYKEVWEKTDFVKDYFDSKKQIWGEEHDGLKIYGFPVEIYVEDANAKNPNSGIYSLEKNEWVVEPDDFQDAEINEERIKEISARLMTEIDDIDDKLKTEKDNHKLETLSTKMKKLFDKLVKQRKESLKKHGEMGTYNIIWKVLRRAGYLDKIWDIINNIYNKVNSIKESVENNGDNSIINETVGSFVRQKFRVLRQLPKPVDFSQAQNTVHWNVDRNERSEAYNLRTKGDPVYSFIVDTGHRNGNEIHTITDRGYIVIQNEVSKKVITVLAARPQQIERYWTNQGLELPHNDLYFDLILKYAGYNRSVGLNKK